MSLHRGWVDIGGNAFVSITLARGETIECLIDTGFDGELLLPLSFAERLRLRVINEEELFLAAGVTTQAFTSVVEINWLGIWREVELTLTDGSDRYSVLPF